MKNSYTHPWTRRKLLQSSLLAAGVGAPTVGSFALSPQPQPSRVIFVYTPQGAPYEHWQPDDCGASFTLRQASAPLEPVKQHCVFFRNMRVDNPGHGVTEKVLGGGFTAGRETTLDVRLGEVLSTDTRVANIMLAAHANYYEYMSKKDNERLPYLNSAAFAYQIFFEEHYNNPQTNTVLDRMLLAVEPQSRLEFDHEVDLQIAFSILALQRRATNVISLMWGDHQAELSLPQSYASTFKGDFHQAVAGFSSSDLFVMFRAYLSAKLAYLIQMLAAARDEAGQSLLDTTLIVHVTDQGDGRDHTGDNAPYLIAGGKNRFRNGRVLDVNYADQYDLMDTLARAYGLQDTRYGDRLIDGLLS